MPYFVPRFLDYWHPDPALFVESDLWPNLILSASARQIPMLLVNGRMSARSYRRWRYLPKTIKALLQRFALCLLRSANAAERFGALGAPHIRIRATPEFHIP